MYMCTAICYGNEDMHYFGRNLDVEGSYEESVVIMPRRFPLSFRCRPKAESHYAMIGIGTVVDGYPLYFDGVNEKGIGIAALNFPGNAYYGASVKGKNNVAPFELIPYILGLCADLEDAEEILRDIRIVSLPFQEEIPLTPLHWIISYQDRSLVLEATKEGTRLYEDPFGVLTNSPPFPFHRENMHRYMGLHEGLEQNTLSSRLPLENVSLGFGAMGIPGDFSSISRFVKAVFVKEKSKTGGTERENISQFFHILQSVAMPKGCVLMANGSYEYTRYTSCYRMEQQKLYYQTYENFTLREFSLWDKSPEDIDLEIYPLA